MHHGVGRKIVLLHHAILDVDRAVERRSESKDHGTLHLLCHGVGVDHGAAINCTYHAVYARYALLQGHFGDLCHDGAKRFVQGHPHGTPFGEGLAPAGLVGSQFQHRRVARRVFEQCQPERQRVLLDRHRNLVHKALREKRIVRMAHGAPETHRHFHTRGHMGHVLVGKAIGQVKQALGRGFVRHVHRA